MKYYLESSSEVFGEIKSTENGLTSEQARRRSAENRQKQACRGQENAADTAFSLAVCRPDDNHPHCRGGNIGNNLRIAKRIPIRRYHYNVRRNS